MLLPVLALVVQVIGTEVSVLQPYEARSQNGEWSVSVDPTSRFGKGPSNVRVEHAGKLAWQAELPFTLFEAQIADTGHLGGYGFTQGFQHMSARGEFVVAIVDPAGNVILDEREPMEPSPQIHGVPDPKSNGVFLSDEGREFVVRIANRDSNAGGEAWWRYELATGATRPSLNPRAKLGVVLGWAFAKNVKPIEGTPLLLVEWSCPEFSTDGGTQHRSYFALLDVEGAPAWALDRPKEFLETRNAESLRSAYRLRWSPGILGLPAPRQFELRHVSEQQRVTYEVVASPGEKPWKVREVARAPWKLEADSSQLLQAEAVEWKDIVTVPLEIEVVSSSQLKSIAALAPSVDGMVRFVQERGPGSMELVTLDAKGQVTALVGLVETPDPVFGDHWLWMGDGSWLVVADGNDKHPAKAWLVEHRTGAVSEILEFPDWRDLSIARRPEGGFVVLSGAFGAGRVGVFAANGELQPGAWSPSDHEVHGDDIAVGKDSSVFILDRSNEEVACFDLEGNLKRTLALPSSEDDPDAEYHYYTRVLTEPAGTLLVYDFDSDTRSEWLRLDAEGKLLGRFSVHRADGSIDVDFRDLVAQDEAGALWGAKDAEIFTIDATGVTTTRHGARVAGPKLEEAEAPFFDALRRPVLRDSRSRDAFVFRPDGKLESVVRAPGKALGDAMAFSMNVLSGPQARFLVQPDDNEDRWLELDSEGKFVAERKLGGELALWLPDGSFWVATSGWRETCDVSRVAPDGTVSLRIERRPDRRFFDQIHAIGPGPEGGFAVLIGQGDQRTILMYDSHGQPTRSASIPEADLPRYANSVCGAGAWAITGGFTNTATVVHVTTGKCFRVEVPSDNDVFGWTLSPDGSEVWCAGINPPALMKLALPKL